MYVSGCNDHVDALIAKFDDETDESPALKLAERVKAFFKKATDEAYQALLDDVQDWLLSNMADNIRGVVSRTAEDVIKSLIAGDEKTFGDLFQFRWGFKDGYYNGERLPSGADLRRKILAMHHDQFESQIIADLEGELAALKRYRNLGAWRTMVEGDL